MHANNPFGIKNSKLLTQYSNLLKYKNTALDIGCARGAKSIYLADLGLKVTAIDKEVPIDFTDTRINIVQTEVQNFNFESYDIILALNVLQFLDKKNQLEILNRIVSSLTSKGVLFITSFTTEDPSYRKSKSIIGHFQANELYNFAIKNNLKIIHYEEQIKEDNHEPLGKHQHGIVELVAEKP